MLILKGSLQKSVIFGLIAGNLHSAILTEESVYWGEGISAYISTSGFTDIKEEITQIIKAHSPDKPYAFVLYYCNRIELNLDDVKELLSELESSGIATNTILACK